MQKQSVKEYSICVIGLLLFWVTGCQHPKEYNITDPNKIAVNYSYGYEGDDSSTTVYAGFTSEDGNGVEIPYGAYVIFGNDTLTFFSKWLYAFHYSGFIDSGTFVFKNSNGITYTQSLLIKSHNLPASFIAVNRHVTDTLIWIGDTLTTGESIVMNIKNINGADDHWVNGNSGKYILIDSNFIRTLYPGVNNATANLVWEYYNGSLSTAGPKGGSLFVTVHNPTKIISVN